MYDHGRTSLEWYKTAIGWQVGLSSSAIAGLSVLAYKLYELGGAASLFILLPIALFGFSATTGVLLHFHLINRIARSELLQHEERRSASWSLTPEERSEAVKNSKTLEEEAKDDRDSVERFHRHCVTGFHFAALSCLLAVPLALLGLLGRDVPAPPPCGPCLRLEHVDTCALATPGPSDKEVVKAPVAVEKTPSAPSSAPPALDVEEGKRPPASAPLAARRRMTDGGTDTSRFPGEAVGPPRAKRTNPSSCR